MKTFSPLLLCLCAVLAVSPSIALADDTSSSSSDGSDSGGATPAQKLERLKEAFAQLDLTDDQKQQMRQIRQTVTDKAERRQEIMAVLTPEQKEKLRQFFMKYRNNGNSVSNATTSSDPTSGASAGASSSDGVGDGSDLAPGAN